MPVLHECQPMILIVEGEETVYDVIAKVLTLDGCQTAWARNGAEAIRLTAKIRPDLVMLDPNLPDRGGVEVLRDLKSIHENIRAIILAGEDAPGVARDAARHSVLGCFAKPFGLHELGEIIRHAFRSGSDSAQDAEDRHVRRAQ